MLTVSRQHHDLLLEIIHEQEAQVESHKLEYAMNSDTDWVNAIRDTARIDQWKPKVGFRDQMVEVAALVLSAIENYDLNHFVPPKPQ